jgi:hypothetical protein
MFAIRQQLEYRITMKPINTKPIPALQQRAGLIIIICGALRRAAVLRPAPVADGSETHGAG